MKFEELLEANINMQNTNSNKYENELLSLGIPKTKIEEVKRRIVSSKNNGTTKSEIKKIFQELLQISEDYFEDVDEYITEGLFKKKAKPTEISTYVNNVNNVNNEKTAKRKKITKGKLVGALLGLASLYGVGNFGAGFVNGLVDAKNFATAEKYNQQTVKVQQKTRDMINPGSQDSLTKQQQAVKYAYDDYDDSEEQYQDAEKQTLTPEERKELEKELKINNLAKNKLTGRKAGNKIVQKAGEAKSAYNKKVDYAKEVNAKSDALANVSDDQIDNKINDINKRNQEIRALLYNEQEEEPKSRMIVENRIKRNIARTAYSSNEEMLMEEVITESIKNSSLSKQLEEKLSNLQKAYNKSVFPEEKEELKKLIETYEEAAREFKECEAEYAINKKQAKLKYKVLQRKYSGIVKKIDVAKLLKSGVKAATLAAILAAGFIIINPFGLATNAQALALDTFASVKLGAELKAESFFTKMGRKLRDGRIHPSMVSKIAKNDAMEDLLIAKSENAFAKEIKKNSGLIGRVAGSVADFFKGKGKSAGEALGSKLFN